MPLSDHLPPDLNLTAAEKRQLTSIERAAAQSLTRRIVGLAVAALFPGMVLAMYVYFLYQAPSAGLTLCKRHGSFYIPEPDMFEKLLKAPISILAITVFLWVTTVWQLQTQQRLVHKILSRLER